MARLFTCGWEWGHGGADTSAAAQGTWLTGAAATTGTAARTGTYGMNFQAEHGFTGALDTTYYAREYIYCHSAPAGEIILLEFVDTGVGDTEIAVVTITASNELRLRYGPAPGTYLYTSSPLSSNTWYRMELSFFVASGSSDDSIELRLDGTTLHASSGLSMSTTAPDDSYWGHDLGTTYIDDCALNDSTGSEQNTWPGEGKILLLRPASQNQRGSWTGGAGGTGDLTTAIDNTPPVGTASETDSTQMESADSSGDNATDEYRSNLTTYDAGGVPSSATIKVLHPIINHGEDVGTNTKTGSFGLQSNPSQTYATFTFGDDVGVLGTFPSNWRTKYGSPVYSPSVTRGSAPVLAVRKTDAGTRVASVDAMGLYVEYQEAGAGSLVLPNPSLRLVRSRQRPR